MRQLVARGLLGIVLIGWALVQVRAGEMEALRADPEVEALLKASPSLQAGAVRFAKLNGRLCVVGTQAAVARDGSFAAGLEAEKIAALEGRKELLGFLQGRKITSRDFLETTSVSKDEVDSVTETFRSLTTSEVEGVLRGVRSAGSWKVKGEPRHYVIQILDVPGKAGRNVAATTASPTTNAPDGGAAPVKSGTTLSASGDRIVVATGRYAYFGNADAARTRALAEAAQNAIRESLGEWITAQELVKNSSKLESQILSRAEGFISQYKILSQGVKGADEYEVVIEAHVSQSKLKSEAVAVGLLQSQVGNPKVSVIAIETVDGKVRRELTGPLNNMLTREFTEVGITPTDMQQAMNALRTTQPGRWAEASLLMEKVRDPLEKEFDVQAFGRLGLASELIVIGMITSKHLGKDSDGVLERYVCTTTLRILDVNTADIFGTVTASQTSVADNPDTAIINVCKKLLPEVRELIPQTLRKWQDMVNNGRRIPLKVEGLPAPQVGREIRRGLAKIPRVQQAEVRNQDQDFLEADVIFKGTNSEFGDAIDDFLDDNLKSWEGAVGYTYKRKQQGALMIITFIKKRTP